MRRERQGHRGAEGPSMGKHRIFCQGPGCRPRATKTECTLTGNGGRRRHAARGPGTSSGVWRAAGAGDVQVVRASHWGRKWRKGEKREGFDDKQRRMRSR